MPLDLGNIFLQLDRVSEMDSVSDELGLAASPTLEEPLRR